MQPVRGRTHQAGNASCRLRCLLFPALIVIPLFACAPMSAPMTDSDPQHRVDVLGSGLIRIVGVGDEAHARPTADRYCASYDSSADFKRLVPQADRRYVFVHRQYFYANDAEYICVPRKS